MTEITIGDRTIPVMLSTMELIDIQKDIGCTVAQLRDDVFGVKEIDVEGDATTKYQITVANDPEKMRKMGTLIRILGNAGLEEDGKDPDLTDKWVLRHLKPALILPMALVLMAVINDAMIMETAKKDENENSGPVDVVIEEKNRKKGQRK